MRNQITRRFLIVAALLASFALPLSALWAQTDDRPALAAKLTAARSQITEISLADAKGLFDKGSYVWVDVRSEDEWKAGHVPGAKHLDRGTLEFNVERAVPDKATAIVVYCKSGDRGAFAARTLAEMGYTNVRNVAGGMVAWEKAAYPVEK